MALLGMPDDVLIRILSSASLNDVINARRVSRRIHWIVEKYNLVKPTVTEFSVVCRGCPSSLRSFEKSVVLHRRAFTQIRMKRERVEKHIQATFSTAIWGVAQSVEYIKTNMRMSKITKSLSFEGVTIDEEFFKMLTAPWNDLTEVSELHLQTCAIEINRDQFIRLLAGMRISSLIIEFCTFHQSLISNQVLMSLENLETFHVRPRSSMWLPELTDELIVFWKQLPKVPRMINLYGCCTNITPIQIPTMFLEAIKQSGDPFEWDFGILRDSSIKPSDHLLALLFDPFFCMHTDEDANEKRFHLSNSSKNMHIYFNVPYGDDFRRNEVTITPSLPTNDILRRLEAIEKKFFVD
ncbi:unnamed protein product [Caenorhabditis bovis]|uniref:F-box domain-containing protein n=1 Tax=Caenorhabditis bovis TaxID=2654633 RepID=A0A8S1E967_9PELO|nr:unnamed protein product [Caenorhabditis bovis]